MKNAFSINIIFLLLSIVGLVLIPRLPVQLYPHNTGNTVHVGYDWPGMGADVVEKEVTSRVEGALSSMRGITWVESESFDAYGTVRVSFEKSVDMDAARFEVSSIMRSLYPRLPEGLQRPRVSYTWGGGQDSPQLLVYTVNGEGSSISLKHYVDKHIIPHISPLGGIRSVSTYGATAMQWELAYDKNVLQGYGLNEWQLSNAVRSYLERHHLGIAYIEKGKEELAINLTVGGQQAENLNWDDIIVAQTNDRIVRLTDVAVPRLKEQLPRSYFRVNGLSTIYLTVHTDKGANQVELAEEVKNVVKNLQPGFPPNFSLAVNYDASKEINQEVRKITSRAFLAMIILLVFVILVSRNWRYLLIIALSLVANLSVAVIFYYILEIEIHLYSLAGITVSLGMIIDNTIVMADHIRHNKNRKAFLAVLAATLTTMGAMVVIFFLKEQQRLNLIDFAIVLLINLMVSLAVSLFLVPALLDRIPLKPIQGRFLRRRKRRVIHLTRIYERFLLFGARHKTGFILVMVWAFGLPVFFLPDKLDEKEDQENNWSRQLYNETLGNTTYLSDVKPWVNWILGGSWYWFTSYQSANSGQHDRSRTRLYARGSMPDGSNIQQMNEVFLELENYLAAYPEIESFVTSIHNIDNGRLEITFVPEEENGAFPHLLKNELIRQANHIGSADFDIWGVGQGFSNNTQEGWFNNHIELRGYNYDLIMAEATMFKDTLLKNKRIEEVIIQTGNSWRGKPRYGFVMGLDAEKMEEVNGSLQDVYRELLFQSPREIRAAEVAGEEGVIPVFLREASSGQTTIWDMHNNMLTASGKAFRLKDVGFLKRERTGNLIRKENQEYLLVVQYDFLGPWELNNRVRKRNLEQLNERLPVGFTAHDKGGYSHWRKEESSQYWLLLVVIGVVFLLCAILFESFLQPLAVIASIPVAMIGLFLTFAMFKIEFDQGGYAAMILLCGLTVNAALYIINDYNNLRQQSSRPSLLLFLKAFNHKIVPILLTTSSTILGLLPFLLAGSKEGFWFSLAAGASGGLIFSLVAVLVWLPLLLLRASHIKKTD